MGRQKRNGLGCLITLRLVICLVCIGIFLFAFVHDDRDITTNHTIISPVESEVNCFYYEQLNEIEKIIYDKLVEMASSGIEKHEFTEIDGPAYEVATERAVYAFENDHPEFFWITNGYYYTTMPTSYTFSFMYYDYWDYTINKQKYIDAVQNEVDKIAALANAYSTDYEKVIFVHDYLVQTAEYDHDALAKSQQTVHAASCEYIYSAYGCLVNKKTVCAGYAKAYKLIMNKLGIDCIYVTGDAGEPHAWNQVVLDGESYYVDVTWDDADWKDYLYDSLYAYLCITDETLAKTHNVDKTKFQIPNCTALTYNYYEYNNYILSAYDFDDVATIIDAQKDNPVTSVKFETNEAYQEALEELITNGAANRIASLRNVKYKYYCNDTHFIITFLK